MKEIKAIIQPHMKPPVFDALAERDDLPGVTVEDTAGWGRSKAAHTDQPVEGGGHRFAKKTKLEIVVTDEMVDEIVALIRESAHTGQPGDGKIFVSDVDDAVRIRTGERGGAAI
ncbi:MAG: P-II family nitrogen regulator [Bradymonadaceae bacterium]